MNPPPIELARLGLDREHFIRADSKSWRGPCPRCGGKRRLLIFTDHPFPKWNASCEACGLKAWADQLEPAVKAAVSPEKRAEWANRNKADEIARAELRKKKMAEFSAVEIWQELADRMPAEQRKQWEAWGVPAEWQQHLKLSYVSDRPYWGADDEMHHSPAFAIPYFHTGFEFKTVQYRLFNPPTPTDRYRFEQGLGTAFYQAEPNQPIDERVIVCEGAKKAMVVHIHGQQKMTCLAIPSKGNFAGIVEALTGRERVYVMLDPDAGLQARKLASAIGPAARVVELPVKIDDALMQYEMTARDLSAYLRQAN